MILFDSVIFVQSNDPQIEEEIKRKVWLSKEYIVQLSEYQPAVNKPKYTRILLHSGKVIIVDLEMAAAARRIGIDK